MSYLVLFCSCIFSPLSIAITSLGEERANLSVFRICACLGLSVSSTSWCLGRAAVCDCGTPWSFLLDLIVSVPECNYFPDNGRKIVI